jgi:hypothetical protein
VLVVRTRSERAVVIKATRGMDEGVRKEEILYLVDYRGESPRSLLRLEVDVESGDGSGGFDLRRPALHQREGRTLIVATRQDHLPAARSRCVAPPPYEVRFELDGGRFRELPVDAPVPPCR